MEFNNAQKTSQWIEKWSPKHSRTDKSTSAIAEHHAEVEKVAASVRAFHERGEKFRIFHGSTNSTRKSAMGKDRSKTVDTSRLNRVLYVNTDPDDLYALVQPNVPMDRLVEATLEYGLVPPVVMEFPGITVGGGYAGTSGESSSFKHGYFNQTLEQVEMVLANGDVVTCSEHERQDLFRGAAGAVGTLGVTTLVKLRLHKATKYVETTYHPVQGGMTEAMEIIQNSRRNCHRSHDRYSSRRPPHPAIQRRQ
jgi:delta24-sterol reductase